MQQFYAYTRVSTARQGEHGVSLEQQREAIQEYADRNNLSIVQWFEEQATAAKQGRVEFNKMMKLLREHKVDGAIIHKIDRSARNLRDWVDIRDLLDQGIKLYFVSESIDLNSRGGLLSADLLAVVADGFSRNLREETKKGFYGRLKQGLYPMPAVVGYLNQGKGKPKIPDPHKAPLVRKAFELYSTGDHGLKELATRMYRLGLRNRGGGKVTFNGMSKLLKNTFYIGIITLRKNGEVYKGLQEPIVPVKLFRRVQMILSGRTANRIYIHDLTYRRMIRCGNCRNRLIGERKKIYIYYRCQTKNCPTNTIREDRLEEAIKSAFQPLQMRKKEYQVLEGLLSKKIDGAAEQRQKKIEALRLSEAKTNDLESRLTDAYLERDIDKASFNRRMKALLMERQEIEQAIREIELENDQSLKRLTELLGLAKDAYTAYKEALKEEKRHMVKTLTSDFVLNKKTPMIELQSSLRVVAKETKMINGRPCRRLDRIADELIATLGL